MSPALFSDRMLLVAVGVTLFVAARIIKLDLHYIRKLTEVKNEEPLDETTEDKTEDVTRTNAAMFFRDQDALNALVECLCNFLPEHDQTYLEYEARRVPRTRPSGESKALQVLNAVLSNNIAAAINAGVISRWLARYPFPSLDSEERHGINNLIQYCYNYDTDMATILSALGSHIDSSRQLRRYGLLAISKIVEDRSAFHDGPDGDDGDDDAEMGDFYDSTWPRAAQSTLNAMLNSDLRNSRSLSDLASNRRRQSPPFLTAAETAARRRRREAVIIDSADEDVEIIMPDMAGSPSIIDSDPEDEELVRELNRQLHESVSR
ncbi:hypothetical protein KEM56_001251 [Ascosphaera pollenicola]|nr:hypothetical protein KEM56_001251 [Ascosphaera pollenicola]